MTYHFSHTSQTHSPSFHYLFFSNSWGLFIEIIFHQQQSFYFPFCLSLFIDHCIFITLTRLQQKNLLFDCHIITLAWAKHTHYPYLLVFLYVVLYLSFLYSKYIFFILKDFFLILASL